MGKIIYTKLFALIAEKGIKKINLRNDYGVHPRTIQKLKNGERVDTDIIVKMCELLDCQPGDFMEYVPDQKND